MESQVLTFLFTDIQGSCELWEKHPRAMTLARARHIEIVVQCVVAAQGQIVRERGEGDSTFSVFARPHNAIAAACQLQIALNQEPWPDDIRMAVRAAIHTGTAEHDGSDYNSADVNRCARIRSLAHGGQTLLSQTTFDLVRDHPPEAVILRSLGTFQLRGILRSEQVYQLCHPDLPSEFPAVKSIDVPFTNLPRQLTSFVGRQFEISEVVAFLRESRVVTLVGTGGCGKTRLAIRVAEEVQEDFADGVWFVELADTADETGDAVITQVATVLRLREERGTALSQTVANFCRDRNLLIVLDNCEHVLGQCADTIQLLMRFCPYTRVLATSRQPFGGAWERSYRVPSLRTPPNPRVLTVEGARSEAVQLFCDRARAVYPSFELTERAAPAVAAICVQLDGIPLAIELAAAWVRSLSPEQFAPRLKDRFRLLISPDRTANVRQQTLRATIDWSYSLLTEPERVLLARLVIFAGGWTLEAAEAVCQGSPLESGDILLMLTRLVDKSLVIMDASTDEPRYRFLETIRQYAQETVGTLPAGLINMEDLRERHARWYLEWAETAEGWLLGDDQAVWMTRLESDHANILAALDASRSSETGLRLAAAAARFWQTRGFYREGMQRLDVVLKWAEQQPASLARAKAFNGLGILAWSRGDYETARSAYEKGLGDFTKAGNQRGMGASTSNLGLLAKDQGRYQEARDLIARSLEIARELGDDWRTAVALNNLGLVQADIGETAAARRLHEESLAIRKRIRDESGVATSLCNLGLCAHRDQDYASARALYDQSLESFRRLGDEAGATYVMLNVADIHYCEGEFDVADAIYGACSNAFQEIEDEWGIAATRVYRGNIALCGEAPDVAGAWYIDALRSFCMLNDVDHILQCLQGLAIIDGLRGDKESSLRLMEAVNAFAGGAPGLQTQARPPLFSAALDKLRADLAVEIGALKQSELIQTSVQEVATWVLERRDPVNNIHAVTTSRTQGESQCAVSRSSA